MEEDQFPDERQTDAGPLVRPSLCALDPMETFENVGQIVCRNPNARIAHGKLDFLFCGPDADRDPARQGELESVGKQVEDDLFPHLPVHIDRVRQRRAVHVQVKAGTFAGGMKVARQLGRKAGEVGRFIDRFHPASRCARSRVGC